MNESNYKLRVLVVDESVVYRRVLTEAVTAMPEVESAIATPNGKIALARLGLQPIDLLLFDLEGQQEDPLAALKDIRAKFPDVVVVAVSSPDSLEAPKVIKALEMGVLEVVVKPADKTGAAGQRDFRRQLEALLKGMRGRREANRARRLLTPGRPGATPGGAPSSLLQPAFRPSLLVTPPAEARLRPAAAPGPLDLVAIGVSTGGPNALKSVIPRLPSGLGVPVLMVQHMPATFTKALAESLDRYSPLDVREAQEGEPVLADTVYLAPGGRHMVVQRERPGLIIGLNNGPPVNSCRPSVDVMLESLAKVNGMRVLAVIMTGMGNDGLAGVAALKRQGGYCLSQSEDSCVVYGMPRAVDEAGLSDEKVHLESLAERIVALIRQGAEKRRQA